MSRRSKAGIAIAAVAVAVPVASVLGRGVGQPAGPGQSAKVGAVETSRVHRVAAPSFAGAKAPVAKAGSSTLKLAYFETRRQNVKPGRSGLVVGPVPRHCHVLNGYYFVPNHHNTTGVLSMGDSPVTGLRKWAFYRDNPSMSQAVKNVKYGVICARGAGILTG